jgi:hypothetical protein
MPKLAFLLSTSNEIEGLEERGGVGKFEGAGCSTPIVEIRIKPKRPKSNLLTIY